MATKILQIVGNLGNEVYTQNDEPTDAKDGALWVDLDDEGIVTDVKAALAEAKASGEFDGEDGRSVTSLSINENGELVTVFSDAEEVNLGTVVGADGKSAYDIAAANGYEGTESEFGVALTEAVNSDGLTEEQAADLEANTKARHEHENKAHVLDHFGLNYASNRPTFKGDNNTLALLSDIDDKIRQQVNGVYAKPADIPAAVESALTEAKENGEFDGNDGFSPIVNVTEIEGGHRVSITDAEGTESFDVLDGVDGQDGADGLSAYQIWLNADNTGTEADFLASLKGADGERGADGVSATHFWNGTTLTITSASGTSSANLKGDKGDTGAAGKDGSDYVLTEADKAEIVEDIKSVCVAKNQGSANVGKMLVVGADGNLTLSDIPENVSGDIIGVLDEDNNIIITGKLTNGTYVFKYENADGTFADIGSLVVGGVVQYSITTTLTECTAASGNAEIINEGETVTLKYVAKDGFALTDTVTVSGASYTWDSTTGTLVLSNPTGDVTVSITATKSGYTNLADPTATGWVNNSRIGSSNTAKPAGSCTGAVVTNYIQFENQTSTIYIKGLDILNKLPDGNVVTHARYSDTNESSVKGVFYGSNISSYCVVTGDVTAFTPDTHMQPGEYVRFTGTLLDGYTAEDVVITIDEPIE